MFDWFKKKKKKNKIINGEVKSVSISNSGVGGGLGGFPSMVIPTGMAAGSSGTYSIGGTYSGPGYFSSMGSSAAYGYTIPPLKNNIISFCGGPTNSEIVRLDSDGSVKWANNVIDIDAAAEAFANSLTLGAEHMAGITQSVKYKMRDSVFEDLINIAKEKGQLTAEDLTYLLEASKIVEKLKGPKE